MQCFDAHVPGARHRDAGAIEQIAPPHNSAASLTSNSQPARRIISQPHASSNSQTHTSNEVLVIASRLKEFIDAKSGGFNTSATVMDALSDFLRIACERAIENARADGRKTVMDRDFSFLKK